MMSIIYLLFFESLNKNIFIFLNELLIYSNKLFIQMIIYFILVIFLFVITTVILTIWHWVKNQVKNRNVEIMAGNQKSTKKDEESNIKYGSPLFFKRFGSILASFASLGVSAFLILTILWKFPYCFDLSESEKIEIATITYIYIIYAWVIISLFFFMMVAIKSSLSVYIEEYIKNHKSDT